MPFYQKIGICIIIDMFMKLIGAYDTTDFIMLASFNNS